MTAPKARGFAILPSAPEKYDRRDQNELRRLIAQAMDTVESATSSGVTGAASSTDNALVRFDGTTGTYLQNSVGILDDAGALTGLSALTATTITGTLATVSQPNVTTMAALTTIGTLIAGAVPASLVTAGTFTGNYVVDGVFSVQESGQASPFFVSASRSSAGGSLTAVQCTASNSPSSGTASNTLGVSGTATHNGAATVTDLIGVQAAVTRLGGTVTNAYGFKVSAMSSTVGTLYGLHIGAQTGGTTNYAIYTDGTAQSRFGGPVTVTGAAAVTYSTGQTLAYVDNDVTGPGTAATRYGQVIDSRMTAAANFDYHAALYITAVLTAGGFTDTVNYGLVIAAPTGGATARAMSISGLSDFGDISTTVLAVNAARSATTNANVAASTTGVSSLRILHGTAPSSPVNGDFWTTTAGFFGRVNGATVGPFMDDTRVVRCLDTNYTSMTGTAGVDNTAQTVKTIAMAANTLSVVGDRVRIRAYWKGDTGSAITATLALNGVTISSTTDSGAASFQVNEAWLHYGDATHANIIAMTAGVVDTTISNNNVAGFSWTASQNVTIAQNAVVNNHIVVFFLAVDIFPIS